MHRSTCLQFFFPISSGNRYILMQTWEAFALKIYNAELADIFI